MNRLKELRKSKGLSIEELSKELKSRGVNVSASAIQKYEQNKRNPKIETLERLADYFRVSVDYLRGIDPYKVYVYYSSYGNRTFLVVAKSKKQANKILSNELRLDSYYKPSDFEVTTYPVDEAMIEEL